MSGIAYPEEGDIAFGCLKRELKTYYISVEANGPLEIAHRDMCLEKAFDRNMVNQYCYFVCDLFKNASLMHSTIFRSSAHIYSSIHVLNCIPERFVNAGTFRLFVVSYFFLSDILVLGANQYSFDPAVVYQSINDLA